MYITVKDSNSITDNTNTTAIDELFAGNFDVDISTTVNKTIRTRTYIQDVATSDTVTNEMILFFTNLVSRIKLSHPNPDEEYTTFRIPKKTHGFREINAPLPVLKEDLKKIADAMDKYLKILKHDSAWAYIEGRDIVGAMKEHTSNESKWYLKLDLHDFFGSCNKEFIVTQLLKIYPFAKFDRDSMTTLLNNIADVATKDNKLPQGTPLSPTLTNLIMVEFDYKINQAIYNLTQEHRLFKQKYIYTRYADDIIISARNKFDYNKIINAIKELFEGTPLTINEEKTRFGSSSGRNWNLGVMCNKENNITIGYRRKQQLKATVHNYMSARGTDDKWSLKDLQWLLGQFSWLKNVEPEYYNHFARYLYNKYNCDVVKLIILDIKYSD